MKGYARPLNISFALLLFCPHIKRCRMQERIFDLFFVKMRDSVVFKDQISASDAG